MDMIDKYNTKQNFDKCLCEIHLVSKLKEFTSEKADCDRTDLVEM